MKRRLWIAEIEKINNSEYTHDHKNENARVCSHHFSPDQYKQGLSHILEDFALPKALTSAETISKTSPSTSNRIVEAKNRVSIVTEGEFKSQTKSTASLTSEDIAMMSSAELRRHLKLLLSSFRSQRSRLTKLADFRKKYEKMSWNRKKAREKKHAQKKQQNRSGKPMRSYDGLNVLEMILKGKVEGKSYHPKVRDFSIQLLSLSPKGYRFVRKAFDNKLPTERVICMWKQMNNASPGMIAQSLVAASKVAEEYQQDTGDTAEFLCKFDEAEIHEALQFIPHLNEILGLVNAGEIVEGGEDFDDEDDDYEEFLAKKVLVLTLKGLNVDMSVPVGYLFIRSLNGAQKGEILTQLIQECWIKYKIKIKTVTCDGDKAHLTMIELLGGKIRLKNLDEKVDTTIKVEANGDVLEVHVMLCQSHMLKNHRTTVGEKGEIEAGTNISEIFSESQLRYFLGEFYDPEHIKTESNQKIEWKYLTTLHELQDLVELHLANKLTRSAIEFHKNKMKVVHAAVAMGDKTSDAIWYLDRNLNLPEFAGSLNSVVFFKVCNLCFDILDSKTENSFKPFKSPLCRENSSEIFEWMDSIEKYFKSLILEGKPLLMSLRLTGFVGTLSGFHVARKLYKEMVLTGRMESIAMHSTNQDELEHFFCRMRSSLGNNTNPTCYQFQCFMKNFLSFHLVQFSTQGNCSLSCADDMKLPEQTKLTEKLPNVPFKFSSQLSAPVKQKQASTVITRKKKKFAFDPESIEKFEHDTICYISGFVQRSIIDKISCKDCSELLNDPESSMNNDFIQFRDKGVNESLLQQPHRELFDICRRSEFLYKIECQSGVKNLTHRVSSKVLANLDKNVLSLFNLHSHNRELDARSDMINRIIDRYLKTRNAHYVRRVNKDRNLFYRQHAAKMILYANK